MSDLSRPIAPAEQRLLDAAWRLYGYPKQTTACHADCVEYLDAARHFCREMVKEDVAVGIAAVEAVARTRTIPVVDAAAVPGMTVRM